MEIIKLTGPEGHTVEVELEESPPIDPSQLNRNVREVYNWSLKLIRPGFSQKSGFLINPYFMNDPQKEIFGRLFTASDGNAGRAKELAEKWQKEEK